MRSLSISSMVRCPSFPPAKMHKRPFRCFLLLTIRHGSSLSPESLPKTNLHITVSHNSLTIMINRSIIKYAEESNDVGHLIKSIRYMLTTLEPSKKPFIGHLEPGSTSDAIMFKPLQHDYSAHCFGRIIIVINRNLDTSILISTIVLSN